MLVNLEAPDFGRYVQASMRRHRVPGLGITLVQDGTTASAAFGKASLDPEKAFTPDTIMPVGSTAKALTAAAAGLLVVDKAFPAFQWDAKMTSLLPDDFVIRGGEHDAVTLEDVLCHRTGMPPHEFSILSPKAKASDNARSLTRNIRNLAPLNDNRARFMYCNIMYTAASYAVQTARNQPYEDAMQENIYKPLQMSSTSQLLSKIVERGHEGRLAVGYMPRKDGVMLPSHACESPEAQGCGQTMSSISDFGKWIKAFMQGDAPFSKELVEQLTAPRLRQEADDSDSDSDASAALPLPFAALGWDVIDYCGVTVIMHRGAETGFQTSHFFVPEFQFGGAIFTNSDDGGEVIRGLTYRIIDEAMKPTSGQPALWTNGSRSNSSSSDSDSEAGSESDSDSDSDSDDEEEIRELQQEMCPGLDEPQPLTEPLSTYTGLYLNDGYRYLKVEEKGGKLVVDAHDRSMAMEIRFLHVAQNRKFIACAHIDADEYPFYVKAEFELVSGKAVRMGIHFETKQEDYIWFDRAEVQSS